MLDITSSSKTPSFSSRSRFVIRHSREDIEKVTSCFTGGNWDAQALSILQGNEQNGCADNKKHPPEVHIKSRLVDRKSGKTRYRFKTFIEVDETGCTPRMRTSYIPSARKKTLSGELSLVGLERGFYTSSRNKPELTDTFSITDWKGPKAQQANLIREVLKSLRRALRSSYTLSHHPCTNDGISDFLTREFFPRKAHFVRISSYYPEERDYIVFPPRRQPQYLFRTVHNNQEYITTITPHQNGNSREYTVSTTASNATAPQANCTVPKDFFSGTMLPRISNNTVQASQKGVLSPSAKDSRPDTASRVQAELIEMIARQIALKREHQLRIAQAREEMKRFNALRTLLITIDIRNFNMVTFLLTLKRAIQRATKGLIPPAITNVLKIGEKPKKSPIIPIKKSGIKKKRYRVFINPEFL